MGNTSPKPVKKHSNISPRTSHTPQPNFSGINIWPSQNPPSFVATAKNEPGIHNTAGSQKAYTFGETSKAGPSHNAYQNSAHGVANPSGPNRQKTDLFGDVNKPGPSRQKTDMYGEMYTPGPSNNNPPKKKYGAPPAKRGPNKQDCGPTTQKYLPRENEKVSDVEKAMLEELDCPVCFECLQPPIYMCTDGHNLCGGCRQKGSIEICPQCRSKMTEQRNFALETIVSKISKPCENKDKGCPVVTKGQDAKNHLENCKYGTMSCPVGNYFHACSWEGLKNELAAHFFNEHKKNFKLKPSKPFTFYNFNLKQNNHIFHLLPRENELFLFHAQVNVSKNVVFFAVQYLGSEYQACKWIYEINIYVPRANNKCMQLKEGCLSNNISIDYMCNFGKCVAVPILALQNYVNDTNGNLVFKVMLHGL